LPKLSHPSGKHPKLGCAIYLDWPDAQLARDFQISFTNLSKARRAHQLANVVKRPDRLRKQAGWRADASQHTTYDERAGWRERATYAEPVSLRASVRLTNPS